ncbi:MAG: autotransporter-associated beta strand repeat-containing protein [Pirellulales bacterium]
MNLTGAINQNVHIIVYGGAGNINVSGTGIASVHSLDKIGSGILNISAPVANPTGNGVRVYAGELRLSGAGAFSGAGTVATILNPGSTLTLDNTGTVTANRLGGRAMTIVGGNLNLLGGATTTTEAIGAPTFNRGQTVITVTDGGAGTNLNFTAASNTVNPAQSTGGSAASALFRGTNLGTAAGAGNATIAWTAGGLGFNGQTGGTGTTTKAIAPWALIDTTATGLGTSFVTADNAAGTGNSGTAILRPLAANEYSTAAALAANANMLITTALTAQNSTAPNSLTFDTGGSLAMGTVAGVQQTLTLSSGGVLVRNGVSATISGGIWSIPAGNSAVYVHTPGTAALTVSSLMTGGNSTTAVGLVKADAGTLTLSTPTLSIPGLSLFNGYSANTLNMQTVVNQGTLKLAGGNNTLGMNNYLEVGVGGTVDLNSTSQYVQGLYTDGTYNGINAVTAGGTVNNTGATQATLVTNSDARNWSGLITGNIFYNKSGSGLLTVYNAQTYTGPTLINAGGISLRDYASLATTSSIDLNYAPLTLDNTGAANISGRLGLVPVTMRGGTLTYNGRSQTETSETIGTVSLAQGQNVINVVAGGTGVNSAVLTANISRPTGSSATAIFGQLGGGTSENGQLGSAPRLLLTSPTLVNDIMPWAVVSREFASYIPGLGVAQLNATGAVGYATNTLAGTPLATDNIRIANVATTTLTGTGTLTINSLNVQYNGNHTIDLGGRTLALASGGLIIATGTDTVTESINNGSLTAGTLNVGGDLYAHLLSYAGANRQATLNAAIVDNGTGPVRLVLNGDQNNTTSNRFNINGVNTYTGGTVINAGLALVGATGNIPAGGITINNAVLAEAVSGQAIPGSINATNVVTLNGNGRLDLSGDTTVAGLVFNNNGGATGPIVNTFVAGANITPTATGRGTLTLTGASAVVADSSNVSSTSIINGRLDTSTGATLTVNPILVNGVSVAPLQATLAIQGWTGSSGTITKAGSGVLSLNSQQNYTGPLTVTAGGISIGLGSTSGLSGTLQGGSRYSTMTLNAGTFLNLNAQDATIGSLAGAGTVFNQNINGSATTKTLNVGFNNASTTFSGTFTRYTDALPTTFQVNKIGSGTMTLTGVSNTTSNLQVSQGGVSFAGTGTGLFGTNIVLSGGTLTLDNSGTNTNHRLTGGAGTGGTLALGGGEFRVIGNSANPTLETIGTLGLNTYAGLSTVTLQADAAQSLTFTATGALGAITNGSSGVFRGLASAAGNGNANLVLSGALNGLGGGGANGTTTMSIRPDILGDASVAGVGTGFLVKDSVTGFLRPLTSGELQSTLVSGSTNTNSNVGIASNITIGGSTLVGSLTLNSGGGLTQRASLLPTSAAEGLPVTQTIGGGGVLALTGNGNINVGRLTTTSNASLFVHTLGNLDITGVLTGTTGGLTKDGAGTLTLNSKQLYTGSSTVNAGTVKLAGGAEHAARLRHPRRSRRPPASV